MTPRSNAAEHTDLAKVNRIHTCPARLSGGRPRRRDWDAGTFGGHFVAAFSQAVQLAYALSNLFRSRGAVTVLGGPHARCYPQDARQYFDYVLGSSSPEPR